jgi:hypothetical protein
MAFFVHIALVDTYRIDPDISLHPAPKNSFEGIVRILRNMESFLSHSKGTVFVGSPHTYEIAVYDGQLPKSCCTSLPLKVLIALLEKVLDSSKTRMERGVVNGL